MTEESTETKPPFFSVVIPVYNKEPHIARSINSVLNQTFQDFELTIVCDPSTDNSNAEVAKFTDPRIRVFHRNEPGPGGYAARNLGIEKAKAEWIAFLDADDEWYPNHLKETVKLIDVGEFDVVSTSWMDVWPLNEEKPTAFHCSYKEKDSMSLTREEYLKLASIGKAPNNTNTTTIKKSLLLKIGGFPVCCNRGGDVATWLRAIWHSGGLLASTTLTAVYHREDSSVTKQTAPEIEGNCVYLACKEKIIEPCTNQEKMSLMRFSNHHLSYGLVRRAAIGNLKYQDCKMHYFSVDKLKHIFFVLYSFLPSLAQKSFWGIYRMVK